MIDKSHLTFYKLYQKVVPLIRNNKLINFILFGFFPLDNKLGGYWDWTTLSIKKMMGKHFTPGMTMLDMGTGPYGILSVYAMRKLKFEAITSVDYCPKLIENAERYNDKNNIIFLLSDLFENVDGRFDMIVFNAPYIDVVFGIESGVLKDDLSMKRWSGGDKGISTIEKFLLDASSHLNDDGLIILGVNHFHIQDELVREKILKSRLNIVEVDKSSLTKACSYLLKLEGC